MDSSQRRHGLPPNAELELMREVTFLEVTFTGLECLLSSANYELLVHVPTPLFDAPSPSASMAMPSISLPKVISSPVQRSSGRLKTVTPGTVAGAYLNDIAFNQPGWNDGCY